MMPPFKRGEDFWIGPQPTRMDQPHPKLVKRLLAGIQDRLRQRRRKQVGSQIRQGRKRLGKG